MLIQIPELLSSAQLQQVHALLEGAEFIDGRLSAGREAQRVKHNEELRADQQRVQQLNQIVMGSLVRHPRYQAATLPQRVAAPYYARYRPGMAYGFHIDDPVMGAGGPQDRYRSDVSITIFLNDPGAYEGGDLVIQTSFGEQRVKLSAGAAVLYPSSSLHRVAAVSRGERLVAVTWLQSLIRDPARRELLYQLHQAREELLAQSPEAASTTLVSNSYANLVRMWAEP